jgi:hypothetical protein
VELPARFSDEIAAAVFALFVLPEQIDDRSVQVFNVHKVPQCRKPAIIVNIMMLFICSYYQKTYNHCFKEKTKTIAKIITVPPYPNYFSSILCAPVKQRNRPQVGSPCLVRSDRENKVEHWQKLACVGMHKEFKGIVRRHTKGRNRGHSDKPRATFGISRAEKTDFCLPPQPSSKRWTSFARYLRAKNRVNIIRPS